MRPRLKGSPAAPDVPPRPKDDPRLLLRHGRLATPSRLEDSPGLLVRHGHLRLVLQGNPQRPDALVLLGRGRRARLRRPRAPSCPTSSASAPLYVEFYEYKPLSQQTGTD